MWDDLPDDVKLELLDPRFASRTHGKRGTYAKANDGKKGCRGPLCRKSERDDAEAKYIRRQANRGKKVIPGTKNEEARARDELLVRIQAWHEGERFLAKLNKLVQADLAPAPENQEAVS